MSRARLPRRIRQLLIALLMLAAGTPVGAATLFDPALRFRTLSTDHFLIYFHQGEDALAARLATIAEDVWPRVGAALGGRAPSRTHVVLADQTELANGWATPLPYNVIVITAAAPAGSDYTGNTDDWLRLVFTHEFTHIVHLDQSGGWARVLRGVFGRTPIALPNLWLPEWQIEGLAVWEESALTTGGRRTAGDFRAIEREAARHDRVEPLDRVNGGLTDWPGGLAQYAYGLGFHEFLAERFGEDRFGQLAQATARTLPFFGSTAYSKVFGESLGNLWREYRNALTSDTRASTASAPQPIRLTHHGHLVSGPRFAPPACDACQGTVIYSVQGPDDFPALWSMADDGSSATRIANRYLGSTVGFAREAIVFDQQERRRNVGMYADLYALDRTSGDVQLLRGTRRLQDPDVSPDGTSIVAVREENGRRDLVVAASPISIGDRSRRAERDSLKVRVVASAPDTQFNAPRWSPDGRQIVAERQRLGALSEIVLVDANSGTTRTLAASPSTRFVSPAWRPDGRSVIVGADFDDGPFNLYEVETTESSSAAVRQLTFVTGGALWPDVSNDGETLVFAGYTPEGFDVFRTPYPHATANSVRRQLIRSPSSAEPLSMAMRANHPYTPWGTLMPTSWSPVLDTGGHQIRAGLATSGLDVLGRHGYSASVTWLVVAPDNAIRPRATTPDWDLGYAYDRWRPSFFATASNHTLFSAGQPDASGRPTQATLREREAQAGVVLPIRRVRVSHRVLASVVRTTDRFTMTQGTRDSTRAALRFGASTGTSHLFANSISAERGISLGSTVEVVRRGLGSSENATVITIDGRAYVPGLAAHQVLALRAAGGSSSGAPDYGRTLLLGGAASNPSVLDFGREAFSLLRGFPAHSFAGTKVALVNADYRVPLLRPERGIGTWPGLLEAVHGAVFADLGHAWTTRFDRHQMKSSAGAELSLDLVVGYSTPLTLAVGAARGHDGARQDDTTSVYVRAGRAF